MPLLAKKIIDMGKRAGNKSINLKGYMVGNAVTSDAIDGNGQVEFAHGLGFIDPPTYHKLEVTCKGNYWNATPGERVGPACWGYPLSQHTYGGQIVYCRSIPPGLSPQVYPVNGPSRSLMVLACHSIF